MREREDEGQREGGRGREDEGSANITSVIRITDNSVYKPRI